MKMGGLDFTNPTDFKITPQTETHTHRAMDGSLHGYKRIKRDKLQLTFGTMTHTQSNLILAWIYERSATGIFELVVDRPSTTDMSNIKNGFIGIVEHFDNTVDIARRPKLSDSFTLNFYIESYETF